MLHNTDTLPKEVVPLLEKHAQILFDVLGNKLVGIYVHGSSVMGGFTATQSDFDYLAVVSEPLTPEERQKLSSAFLEIYGQNVPAKGVEMSIISEKFAGKDFRYPTPYEFHMGTQEQIQFHGLPHKEEMTDPDLAAHLTIVKKRGLCVYGKSIEEVFIDIPREYYLDSIAKDSEESFQNIQSKTGNGECVVPNYAVLNFCRVLAFVQENLITSKVEGGEWALKNLPKKYCPIISAALQEYQNTGTSEKIDGQLLKDFAVYAHDKINQSLSPMADLRRATVIASAGASTRLAGSKLSDEEVEKISKSSEQK